MKFLIFDLMLLLNYDYHLEEPGVEGSIILKCILEKWEGDMAWIDLAEDMER
jgi:hypothetical protein